MGAPDRVDLDGINHYWDLMTSGARPTSQTLDPMIARQIDRLHAGYRAMGADPEFLQRLRRELTISPAVVSSPALRGALHGGRPLNWRSSAIARSGAPGLSSRVAAWWRPARLAIALVLLAVIVSGGTAYRQE